MKNLIGKKIRGFYFKDKSFLSYSSEMDDFIGEVGEIVEQNSSEVTIEFETDAFSYPLPEALEHLVEEEPIIPELEGVEMEVSQDQTTWYRCKVIAQYKGYFIAEDGGSCGLWRYARPINQIKKLTMEELEKIVGFKFEIV